MKHYDRRWCSTFVSLFILLGLVSATGQAQEVAVIEHELENGMKV